MSVDKEVPTVEELYEQGITIDETLVGAKKTVGDIDIRLEVLKAFAYQGMNKATVEKIVETTLSIVHREWGYA